MISIIILFVMTNMGFYYLGTLKSCFSKKEIKKKKLNLLTKKEIKNFNNEFDKILNCFNISKSE